MNSLQNEVYKIINLLEQNGFSSKLVGGCVRDELMQIKPKDYDIASTAPPKDILLCLETHKYKCIPTGIEHGTITVCLNSGQVEITTLRKDVKTDGRHATVEFGTSFIDDAKRRDFTINALYKDNNGKISDFFDGQNHIKNKQLIFVGDPNIRIQEDYLRIMRFLRFLSRFGFTYSSSVLTAIKSNKDGLATISQERKIRELSEILKGKYLSQALTIMTDLRLYKYILVHLDKEADIEQFSKISTEYVDTIKNLDSNYKLHCFIAISYLICEEKTNFKKMKADAHKLKISNKDAHYINILSLGNEIRKKDFPDIATQLLFMETCLINKKSTFFTTICIPFWKNFFKKDSTTTKKIDLLVQTHSKHAHRLQDILPLSFNEIKTKLQIESNKTISDIYSSMRYEYLNGTWKSHQEGLKTLDKIYKKHI
jgi:tRNA nucleotidyltransferase/poly(A) polymerase